MQALPAETGRFPLFGNATNERIVAIITTDWTRFSAVAHFLTGIAQTWVDAVAEYDMLQQVFIREGRDTATLDPVFDLLHDRAWWAGVGGGEEQAHEWMWDRLGLADAVGDYRAWRKRRQQQQREWDKQERQAMVDAALIAKYGPDALVLLGRKPYNARVR